MIHRFRIRMVPQIPIIMHNLRPVLLKTMRAALRTQAVDKPCEVQFTMVTDSMIKRLNRIHRKKDAVTDVLSFPFQNHVPSAPLIVQPGDINPETGRLPIGDIIMCLPQAQRQAKEFHHSLEREVSFLTAHAMLHLLGHDHENGGQEEARMQAEEKKIMAALGIFRPH